MHIPQGPAQGRGRHITIKEHVQEAHRHIQMAQVLAYGKEPKRLTVRLALNRAQHILIKLLVREEV